MSQRTQILALAVGALVVFAVIAVVVDPLEIFSPGESDRPANIQVAGGDGESRHPGSFRVDGEDEHGEYMLSEDGERIYRDAQGRRYVIGPDGKRWFIDEQGRRYILGPDGQRVYLGEDGKRYTLGPDGLRSPIKEDGPSGTGPAVPQAGEGEPGPVDDESKQDEPAKLATLRGRVVDNFGNAYAGVTVVAQVVDAASHKTTSDDEGAFVLKDLPAQAPLVVTARDEWGNTSKPLNTRLAEGKTALKEALVLPRDTSIRGVVRSAENGLPIADASVLLLGSGDSYGRRYKTESSLKTSPDGAFRFDKLTPQGYRIQVVRDGYTPRILNNVEPPTDLVVEMSPGAVITGTVRDTAGTPIPGALVSCDFHAEPAQDFHTEAYTDDAGFYAVKCQPESQHNRISVIAPGYKSASTTLVKSGTENLNFNLQPTGNTILRGRLLDHASQPVAVSATFTAYAGSKKTQVNASIGPKADGTFRCEVSNDTDELRIRVNGMAELSVPVSAEPGAEIDLGDLYMDLGYTVFGVLTERDQAEVFIEGAEVRVGGVKTYTDASGAYRIEGIPTSEFIVRVLHAAYLGTAQQVEAGPGEYEIELNMELAKASFEARVIVKEADTLSPLEGVKVTLTAYGQEQFSDASGLVHFTELSSMSIDARFEKDGYATIETKIAADVSAKVAEAPPQEIILPKGNAFDGTVTTEGEPVPGATKVEIWNTSKLAATVYTDSEGKYNTEALPVGQYFIGLPDYHYAARAVELPEEGATHDIEIGAVCHLRGKLLRYDGTPHANAGVYIYRRDNTYWTATIHTGPGGEYEVSNLFPGEWVFCALKTQGDTAAQFAVEVTVTEAGWNDIDVQLPQITGVMTGRVTYPDGEPVKRARVAVTNISANFERALLAAYVVTDDEGYYTAERLENGMQMQARVGGYRDEAETGTAFSEVVTIPAGSTPVESDMVVPRTGHTVRVNMWREDGGPILSGGPLSYLLDSEGRLSGLYFGASGFSGHIDLYDVTPGTYTLVVTNRGMKKATLEFTVTGDNPGGWDEVILQVEDRSGG